MRRFARGTLQIQKVLFTAWHGSALVRNGIPATGIHRPAELFRLLDM